MNNVAVIVDNNMCTGCCECISACTSNSIFIMMSKTLGHPVPYITECDNCGECLKSCPQQHLIQVSPA